MTTLHSSGDNNRMILGSQVYLMSSIDQDSVEDQLKTEERQTKPRWQIHGVSMQQPFGFTRVVDGEAIHAYHEGTEKL